MKPKTEIRVIPARELGDGVRDDIGTIFTEGFYQWLHFFSKDKERLTRAFRHMFQLDLFYVALIDGDVVGIAACTDGKTPCVKIETRELRRHLGFVRGIIAGAVLKDQLERHAYPFALDPRGKTGSVEFVATSPRYRGQGVASAIIRHFFSFPQYDEFVLEVADTNAGAVMLYEKLGFCECMRVKMQNQKRSGVNYLVYMRANARGWE